MTDPFSAPGAGGKFSAENHNGDLLLIRPTEYVKQFPTTFGTKDVVRASVVVIDENDPANSEEIDDAILFGGVLVGQTKSKIGQPIPVLGRLGQGTAKPGQKPPWVLADPTDAEKDVARKYLASKAPQL
jgi:hypothetical protein